MPEEDPLLNNEETLDSEKIANLLNEAAVKESVRLNNLKQVQDLILRKNPTLLDNFLDEIFEFQLDKSSEIKKFLVSFIEEACKQDNEVIFQLIDNFRYLLYDDNVNVQKRSYYAMIAIFKSTLKYIAKSKSTLDETKIQTWLSLNDLVNHVTSLLDSDNDGVRTAAIKFIEMLVVVLSERTKDSIVPSINERDISIEQISDDHELLDKTNMIEEGRHHMRKLIEYTLSNHISSVNLIASISVLSNISKQRPEYLKVVLETYSTLLSNMPPTLGKSQVSTVKKQMKLQLITICKTSHAIEFQPQITSLLSDLGLSSNEITKAFPKISSTEANQRKRNLSELNSSFNTKRSKLIPTNPKLKEEQTKKKETISGLPSLESVVEDLIQKLNVQENVADLVMVSMAYLPDQMPTKFQITYKPISNAGTSNQIKILARMLAFQLNEAGLISFSGNSATKMIIDDLDEDIDNDENEFSSETKSKIENPLEKSDIHSNETKPMTKFQRGNSTIASIQSKPRPVIENLMAKKINIKTFKLSEVTANASNEFNQQTVQELLKKTYNRILNSEETVMKCPEASLIRKKVIIETTSLPNYEKYLTNYIFDDVRKRIDLGLMWIFNNYLNLKSAQDKLNKIKMEDDDEIVEVKPLKEDNEEEEDENLKLIKKYESNYDRTLYSILINLQQRQDPRDFLFSKIICQVPLLTENCLKLLKSFCQDERRFYFSMSTLRDLIVTRQAQRQILLNLLLEFTYNKNTTIRENSITICLKLHEHDEFRIVIEKFALERLKFLVSPSMPNNLQAEEGVTGSNNQWTEDAIKSCLYLYLDLMPANHSLIHPLSQIYIGSTSEVKRVILKMLESPIKAIGMQSNELLRLIEEFIKGSETFVLRIIHILTEKSIPSPKLVEKVRELYNKRLPDVRFLIPILTGLTQKEIISALPQLIKLSQAVYKEVFNRLLGINVDASIHKSPISPAELLIALHQIDPNTCDLKTVIQATSLCFAEKKVYTEEVLATVMQQLIDVTPIPTLYMRTVIQSVTMYPKLNGFVVIMMQRLISKQVWKQPKIWEGFIKCCQRIKPSSYQLLLQLPPAQLKEVLTAAPDLKENLCKYVQELDAQQKSLISDQLLSIIEAN